MFKEWTRGIDVEFGKALYSSQASLNTRLALPIRIRANSGQDICHSTQSHLPLVFPALPQSSNMFVSVSTDRETEKESLSCFDYTSDQMRQFLHRHACFEFSSTENGTERFYTRIEISRLNRRLTLNPPVLSDAHA